MLLKRNKLIFTDSIKKNNIKFNYIDVGARGDISSPWKELEKDTFSMQAPVNITPDKLEPVKLILDNFAFVKLAPSKSEKDKSTLVKSELEKLVSENFEFGNLELDIFDPSKLASSKFKP